MSIAWSTVRAAIAAWVRAGSGFDNEHVIWAQQGRPTPSGPYVELRVRSVRRRGQDWLTVTENVGGAPGQEIVHTLRGPRVLTLSMQCFSGTGPNVGAHSPVATLEAVLSAARLPNVHAALATAGVGVVPSADVMGLDGNLGFTVFEPRAIVEVKLHVTSEITELGTFIEFVELTSEDPLTPATVYVPEDPH